MITADEVRKIVNDTKSEVIAYWTEILEPLIIEAQKNGNKYLRYERWNGPDYVLEMLKEHGYEVKVLSYSPAADPLYVLKIKW